MKTNFNLKLIVGNVAGRLKQNTTYNTTYEIIVGAICGFLNSNYVIVKLLFGHIEYKTNS